MLKISNVNKDSLSVIEASLFAICIDDRSHPDNYDFTLRTLPIDLYYIFNQISENNAHSFDGHNRWYDKAISVVCNSNGRAGMNGEVSF